MPERKCQGNGKEFMTGSATFSLPRDALTIHIFVEGRKKK
jgi:hypothetical protein